jgi:hypothetical protein
MDRSATSGRCLRSLRRALTTFGINWMICDRHVRQRDRPADANHRRPFERRRAPGRRGILWRGSRPFCRWFREPLVRRGSAHRLSVPVSFALYTQRAAEVALCAISNFRVFTYCSGDRNCSRIIANSTSPLELGSPQFWRKIKRFTYPVCERPLYLVSVNKLEQVAISRFLGRPMHGSEPTDFTWQKNPYF